ncbi:hypothetical protein PoB_002511600 [Plakobranchus ocellatus]|uniref:Uncharacterized protein n=1 Tax=Plakobranchus ocellatus TaxID=259542 RepID=A0AAV3ZRL7_9GAST|nr:hypothetical protein PoB_002511600 [Plakobranchus ocellatus]
MRTRPELWRQGPFRHEFEPAIDAQARWEPESLRSPCRGQRASVSVFSGVPDSRASQDCPLTGQAKPSQAYLLSAVCLTQMCASSRLGLTGLVSLTQTDPTQASST